MAAASAADAVSLHLGGCAKAGVGIGADGLGLVKRLVLVAATHLGRVGLCPRAAVSALAPAADERVRAAAHLVLLGRAHPPSGLIAAAKSATTDVAIRGVKIHACAHLFSSQISTLAHLRSVLLC